MKPRKPKTIDGKNVINLSFCKLANVWTGLVEIKPGQYRAAMWTKERQHIQKANSNLNLSF